MSLQMMSKLVLQRELSRCRCVLPFCYRLDTPVKPFVDLTTNPIPIRRHLATKSDENVDQTKSESNLEDNPFYAKYVDKIKTALREKASDWNIDATRFGISDSSNSTKNLNEEEVNSNPNDIWKQRKQTMLSMNRKQSLNDIVKLDLLRHKSAEEITEIWKTYHKDKDVIYAVIPGRLYERIYWHAYKYKMFIYPVPKEGTAPTHRLQQINTNNYEFVLSQWDGHKCHFTPLIQFHTHGESAPVCLTIHHFPELQKDKGIVLMLGEYDPNVLNPFEAQCLANQLQWYYSAEPSVKQNMLLYRFNLEPARFEHNHVIRELEDNLMAFGMANYRPKK